VRDAEGERLLAEHLDVAGEVGPLPAEGLLPGRSEDVLEQPPLLGRLVGEVLEIVHERSGVGGSAREPLAHRGIVDARLTAAECQD